jgi:glyceraldehyde 3-phosphate dehydrogenase
VLKKPATDKELNAAIQSAASGALKGILQYCDEPLVSADFIGNQHSSIFDALSTKVIDGNFAKVLAWYDNEMGYATRVADLCVLMGR